MSDTPENEEDFDVEELLGDLAKQCGVSLESFKDELYNGMLDTEEDHEKLRFWAKLTGKLARERALEIRDLRSQLAAQDAEIAAMRPVIDSCKELARTIAEGEDSLDIGEAAVSVALAFREYESKVTK